MNDLSVFVLAMFDEDWPSSVAAVILAKDRYEAEDKAELVCYLNHWDFDDFEVMPWYEEDEVAEVYCG